MRVRSKIAGRVLVFGAAALLGSALAAQEPESPGKAKVTPPSFSIPRGALVAPGKTPDLTLLYTGNVIGYLEPCG